MESMDIGAGSVSQVQLSLSTRVKIRAKRSSWYRLWINYRENNEIRAWKRNGSPMPMPHKLKRDVILSFKARYEPVVFVETGTFLGQAIMAMKNHFAQVYSIELDPNLYLQAKALFAKDGNVFLSCGDSGALLSNDLALRKMRPAWDPLFQWIYRRSPVPLRHILDYFNSRTTPSFTPDT